VLLLLPRIDDTLRQRMRDDLSSRAEGEFALIHACKRSRICAALLAGVILFPAQSMAQTTPDPEVKVTGQKMPRSEAPRSATCEALARDPFFRAQMDANDGDPFMGPRVFIPTRLPRNPDYSKPPSVPAGSELPDLPKSRFGMQYRMLNGQASVTEPQATASASGDAATPVSGAAYGYNAASSAGDGGPPSDLVASMEGSTLDAAIDSCRGAYSRGSGGAGAGRSIGSRVTESPGEASQMTALNAHVATARSWIASQDTTLPMAFALFDQGRYPESLDWFRKAEGKLPFQDGGDEAALFIGKIYLLGLGEKSDSAEALKWLTKAATGPFNPVTETPAFDPKQPERNTAAGEAAVILANLYRRGYPGIARDPAEALKWYTRAYRIGHIPAAKMLGDFYEAGIGAPRDPKKAASYYEQAAKLDYAPAQFALAELLSRSDEGVRQDRKKALGWYQAAAKHNHGGAIYALARAYDLGDGVKADPQMAIGFYKNAALQGNAAAMVAMGTYFYEGKLVPKDDATARRWFQAGAAASDVDGMFDLAAMLANGQGGGKDVIGAWLWLKRAAALGHEKAPAAISALEGRMTPAERQAAAARLAVR